MESIFRFLKELKRRNVHKGIISYVVFSWVLLQVISVLGSLVELPIWLGKAVLVTLLILFPFWVVFSWLYDITSEGVKLTSSQKSQYTPERNETVNKRLNTFIVIFLMLAVILLFVDRFRITTQYETKEITSQVEQENSIAVLPFNDMSILKNQAYFADGLAEELINTLSKIVGIRVTSRTSAFSFRGKTIDIPTIAKKLNVKYILEGSVRMYDSIVRINVQLIDAKKDKSTWSETWDKQLENILEVQNEISSNIAERLEISITDNNIPKAKKVDPAAYRLYLEANYEMNKTFSIDGDKKAKDLLLKSLEIDPTFAPAWDLLSTVYHFLTDHGILTVEEGYPLVKGSALKAVEQDSLYATIYEILGTIAISYERDYDKAQEYVNKGLSLEPNNTAVLNRAAQVALLFNETKKAVAYHEKILALDPLSEYSYYALGINYYYARMYPESETTLRKALKITPEADITHLLLTCTLLQLGRFKEALKHAEMESSEPLRYHALALAYYSLGNVEKSQEFLEKLITTYSKDYSYTIAITYAQRGDRDATFEWLEKAIEYQDFGITDLNVEPLFDRVKEDPRWPMFIDRLGLVYKKI
jgi:TolB-like protein/lipopolysaccharide biosynthesis regulator YciM